MVDWLKSVLSRIKDGTLLPAAHYGELDCDAALDARDGDSEFDSEWVRLSNAIEGRWGVATIDAEGEALAEAESRSWPLVGPLGSTRLPVMSRTTSS